MAAFATKRIAKLPRIFDPSHVASLLSEAQTPRQFFGC